MLWFQMLVGVCQYVQYTPRTLPQTAVTQPVCDYARGQRAIR